MWPRNAISKLAQERRTFIANALKLRLSCTTLLIWYGFGSTLAEAFPYCRVNNVVYILTCNQCKKQYIGETGRPFIERWKEHLYDIKVKQPYPVARHFNESDNHQEAMFHAKILSLIKGPANRVTARRKYRESRWISIFKSFQPEGINVRE